MKQLLRKVIDFYNYVNDDLSDARTKDLYIVNPILMICVVTLYYKLVTKWGPDFMEKREPFKIEKLMKVYNLLQIVICGGLSLIVIKDVWLSGYYSVTCQPITWGTSPMELDIIRYGKYYYWLKIADLLDTIFFVLRKKNNQVTFLHLYHHVVMIFLGFMSVKYIPAGHGAMLGTINCVVHSVMYTYYLLTAIDPEYKKSIWWKKHLTQLQLLQFVLLFIHFAHIIFRPSCTYPKWVSLAFLPQNAFMIFMFSDFYYKTYIKSKRVD